jgi:hypothetical protein
MKLMFLKSLSEANVGKCWWSNDEIKISILTKENKLNKKYTWYKGRKYGNKNRIS